MIPYKFKLMSDIDNNPLRLKVLIGYPIHV